jgi:hypothetical protein
MRETKVSTFAVNLQADAVGSSLDDGYLHVYGDAKPASCDIAPADIPLATLRFGLPAFNPAVNGVILSLPLTPDTNTSGGKDAVWFRASTVSGDSVFDGTVGLTGGDEGNLNINESLTVQPGGELHIGSVAYRVVSP